ncbi:MAG: 16S rRNA (cytidine(1402)-2'-O)-methyltransferase [Acidimicrobiales bacterium]
MSGALVVVGTPIGNLGDLSPRAAEALATADAIACEDTRRTGRLLVHLGIAAPALLVANEHTERARAAEILDRLAGGERVALVSDAGMPTVSDPGRRLVEAAAAAGYTVDVVPGPVAAATALALSGFDGSRFVFEGFLPRKGSARAERLAAVAAEGRTVVCYEAPHRLRRTLSDLVERCGPDRPAAVARELTKLHQEVVRGTLADVTAHFDRVEPRGEFALVLAGAVDEAAPLDDRDLVAQLEGFLAEGSSRRDAVAAVVRQTGEPKRRVYDLATRMGSSP